MSDLVNMLEKMGIHFTIIEIPDNGIVLCDMCNTDYTLSDDKGGILFGDNGVCPNCADRMLPDIERYGETQYINDKAGPDETFKDFIYRVRKQQRG